MAGALSVRLVDPDEVRSAINDRTHWVLGWAPSTGDAVDRFDKALGHYPTYPSLTTPVGLITLVPKSELMAARLAEILEGLKAVAPGVVSDDHDILMFAATDREHIALMQQVEIAAQPLEPQGG